MKNFYIQWHLLNRCNLRCTHCYQGDFSSKEEISFENLLKVFNNLAYSMEILNSNLSVALTGGEPFLYKNLFKLIERIEKNLYFKSFSIITNGLLLPYHLKTLKNFKKLKDLKISLEGFCEKTNDLIRGKGTFKKILEAIEEAKAEKFKVFIMFTVMKKNLKETDNLIPFMKTYGLNGAIVERFIPLGRGKIIKEEILDLLDWKKVCLKLLKNLKLEVELKELSPFKAFKIEWKDGELELFGSKCILGKDGGALMPSGDFYPCRRLPLSQGNLIDKNLKEIFEGSILLNTFKDKNNLKGICKNCKFKFCIGCRAYVYALKGEILGEDMTCFLKE